jgi:hypothetical protein
MNRYMIARVVGTTAAKMRRFWREKIFSTWAIRVTTGTTRKGKLSKGHDRCLCLNNKKT